MNWAEIKTNDIANGEGIRTSIFVSGCKHRCKNCFNQIAWDFTFGKPFTNETARNIFKSVEPHWINGITLLGGEPFEPENQSALLDFLKAFHEKFPKKTVWCYTGFTFEEISGISSEKSRASTDTALEMLKYIDILVDGRFIEEKKDIRLKFRGSANQRVIDIKKTLKTNKIVLYLE